MLKFRIAAGSLLSLALVLGTALAAESIKSGPQVGDDVPGPFHPLNVTGEKAGEKNCLFCSNGSNPVAMIFARETSDELTALIKKIDACTEKNKDNKMGSFVVFLSDSEGLADQLKKLAEKESIKRCVLSIDNPSGPKAYNVSKDADVTVVLYTNRVVKANYAFKKGELKEKDIDVVLGDVSKILPKE
jgi:hypothetical protein